MIKQSVSEFLDSLASDAPTPGGGAAAAVSAAMGCSLMAMALRVSQRKVQDADLEETAKKLDSLRFRLLELSEKDAEAFESYMDALHLPKDNEEQKLVRSETIKKALVEATKVPLSTMELIQESIITVKPHAGKVIPSVASDLYSGIKLAEAAMYSAFANVKINSTKKETQPLYETALQVLNQFIDEEESLENTAKQILGL